MLRALLQLPAVSSHRQGGRQGPAQGHTGRGQMGAAGPGFQQRASRQETSHRGDTKSDDTAESGHREADTATSTQLLQNLPLIIWIEKCYLIQLLLLLQPSLSSTNSSINTAVLQNHATDTKHCTIILEVLIHGFLLSNVFKIIFPSCYKRDHF